MAHINTYLNRDAFKICYSNVDTLLLVTDNRQTQTVMHVCGAQGLNRASASRGLDTHHVKNVLVSFQVVQVDLDLFWSTKVFL